MKFVKLISPVLAAAILLAGLAGCGPSTAAARPIDLVPQDAGFVANVQLSKILNDTDIRTAYDQAKKSPGQPQTVDEALNKVIDESGIDLRDFSQALVFGDTTNLQRGDYVGLVIEGNFNQATFIGNVEARAKQKFTTSDYKGIKLYTGQDGKLALAFLSNTTLLLGSPKAVQDTIDVSKGERNRLAGQVLNTYNGLGDGLIKMAFQIPESARQGLAKDSTQGVPFSMKPFADTDAVGLAMNKSAGTVSIRIDAHFVSSTSAQDAKDTLSGAITLLKGMSQDAQVKDLLGKIQVSVSDSSLTLNLNATLTQLESFVKGFQK